MDAPSTPAPKAGDPVNVPPKGNLRGTHTSLPPHGRKHQQEAPTNFASRRGRRAFNGEADTRVLGMSVFIVHAYKNPILLLFH